MREIKAELDRLAPEAAEAQARLSVMANERFQLYNSSKALDPDIAILAFQKAGLKRDQKSGRDGLAEADRIWDSFKRLLDSVDAPPEVPDPCAASSSFAPPALIPPTIEPTGPEVVPAIEAMQPNPPVSAEIAREAGAPDFDKPSVL